MKYRALTSFCTGPGTHVQAGEVFEVPEEHVREWTYMRMIEGPIEEIAETPAAVKVDVVQAPSPAPVHREPSLRTTR